MFYHQEILKRRGGHFGIVWIAATKCVQLSKRELCSVNVKRTCDEIIDTIMMRAHPLIPGGKRPRFSLYLSSQLMYGVVQVHKKHCEYLLGEANAFFTRVRVAVANVDDIDLRIYPRLDMVTNTDFAEISRQNQIGFDQEFGLLKLDDLDPFSSLNYPDMEMWRVQSSMIITGSPYGSPVLSRASIPTTPKSATDKRLKKGDMLALHTVSSPEEITMKEVDYQIPDIEIPGVKDLPGFDGKEMETILEEAALEPVKLEDLMSPIIQSIISDDVSSRHVLSPKEKTLIRSSDEEAPVGQEIQEKTPHVALDEGVPLRREIPPSPGITPAPATDAESWPARRIRPSLTLELSPVTPSPARRRRKRLFADRETQISRTQMRENMKTGQDTCHPFVLPDPKGSAVMELFNRPERSELRHNPLLPLWRRNARFGICETDSDLAVPIWSVPGLEEELQGRKRRRITPPPLEMSPVLHVRKELSPDYQRIVSPEIQQPQPGPEEIEQEMPSIEVAREASSISLERTRAETPVRLQISEHDVSDREDSMTRRSRRRTRSSKGGTSSEEEFEPSLILEPVIQESITNLATVPEEMEFHPSPVKRPRTEDMPSPVQSRLVRMVNSKTQSDKWTTFRDICPPTHCTRLYAAKMFSALLDLCADATVDVKQRHPFEDIFICRGRNM